MEDADEIDHVMKDDTDEDFVIEFVEEVDRIDIVLEYDTEDDSPSEVVEDAVDCWLEDAFDKFVWIEFVEEAD